MELILEQLKKSFGEKEVLKGASYTFRKFQRASLTREVRKCRNKGKHSSKAK